MLPEKVLRQAQAELLEYGDSGQSVMEMSHRSKWFDAIITETEATLRRVMNIPDDYKVGFFQGGATQQFAMVPMNLMTTGEADYLVTGQFSGKAAKEAEKFGRVNVPASSKDKNFTYIPDVDAVEYSKNASYIHICENNTIYGTVWHQLPDTGNVPLVADISSCILSKPIDVSRFGLLYAGAQKNVAPAGLTIVIVREDLLGEPMEFTPTMFNYKVMAENDSMYNTPPCWPIYISKLVLEWIKKDIGGLEKMEERNVRKAQLLYDFLDNSSLFTGCADKADRSIMNVTFVTGDKDLDAKFVKESTDAGFVNLKGHRSVGGMRASIYNAMPEEGIVKLVEFMKKFELENK